MFQIVDVILMTVCLLLKDSKGRIAFRRFRPYL